MSCKQDWKERLGSWSGIINNGKWTIYSNQRLLELFPLKGEVLLPLAGRRHHLYLLNSRELKVEWTILKLQNLTTKP